MTNLLRRLTGKQAAPALPRGDRNTDADWRMIGADEPFYGVLSNDRFRRDQLTDAAKEEFYGSGAHEIAHQFSRMKHYFPDFAPRSALDFGCGVGRLTGPLAELTGDAIGFDISPGMLAEARKFEKPALAFTNNFPERTFDWVVSLIVLQHITPEQGHEAIDKLLKAVGPGGGVTLQVTFARRFECGGVGYRLLIEDGRVRPAECPVGTDHVEPGIMIMHDYDLGRVITQFVLADFASVQLETTDHGGHIGAVLYAKRDS